MPPEPPPELLRTTRLLLRPPRPEDAAVHHRLWTESDPRVPPHRRLDAEGRPSVDDLAARIRQAGRSSGLGLLTVARRDTGAVIGYCGLTAAGRGTDDEPELAYELVRSAHGQGYATEAAGAVVAWADQVGHPRLWASVWAWNVASRRVLAKLGFRETDEVEHDPERGDNLMTVLELGSPGS